MTAEMVTGALVSAFLERTIDTLASRFMDIFRARKHKKKQLSDLKMKLFTIDVVAYDAEQKQFRDPRVRDWLLRAKDVVFDAEDLLDEIDYELLTNQVVEAESQSATKKVWNSLKSSFVSFFENEIESKMDQVIEDLEDLATQSDFLGLKKASGAGIGSESGNLKHLRSLDLSHTDIEKLPDSMSLLYKLQILKLNKCEKLKELPSYLHELDNLRCLELVNTGVKNVPAHLGKMKNVQVLMSPFYVEKSKEFSIQQLGDLNLHGSLTIDELQNIENPSYALEANLKSKAHLVELVLNWNFIENSSVDSAKAGDVIENLRPSKYLKKLAIKNYVGNQLPNWLLNNSLLNMVSLVLRRCKSCQRFPPLGLLPFLKNLEISGFEEIVNIDADFHGNNSSSFKSLERLEFSSMSQWEKWDCQDVTGAFPRLHYFSISSCPKLKGHLPEFVALKTLRVIRCEHIEALIVYAIELRLQDCGKLQLELSTMNKLRMSGHTMEASMVKTVGHIIFNTSLDYLSIYSPLNSISDDCVSLRTFPLHFFPKLKNLYLGGFCNLQRISQHEPHNHLKDLTIKNCPKFESFPENMHRMSLWELWIEECPKLESFPNGGLPSNLSYMNLKDCSKLIGSLRGAFRDNPSLRCLWIEKVDAKSFPDEGLLPCSLVSLTILDFPNLEKLDHKGLYQLSSLENLGLWNCPNLQHLPEEGLPISISHLQIRNCPLLKERCQEEGGEDWQKIAHIQDLEIQE
ncbi:hypothetical protein DEO72_LG3g223 [Vigna unguiculata]|uniref:Uncharacterized protein n=1 Tax=Vigna unguiculata TaxID=3917 RepID=A0A4D6LB34_VIGUN|nr:hypothetical protein DEO72_LG3g223 [Vigna unguiculata]